MPIFPIIISASTYLLAAYTGLCIATKIIESPLCQKMLNSKMGEDGYYHFIKD